MTENTSHSVNKKEIITVFLLLLVLSTGFYHTAITRFPSHLHAWTQSDRYALAVGFVENGMNPFLPSTLNLHPKFPPKQPLTIENGITRVDFPFVEYLSAAVMKIIQSNHPFIFRSITLLFGILGLLFLFALFRSAGESFALSLLSVLFVFLAPVFTYYLNGFIPSIPALSFSFVAFYFYLRYLQDQKHATFAITILFFGLAALIRSPFLMPMVAVVLVQLASNFKQKKLFLTELGIAAAGFFTFALAQFYNAFLGHRYGSLFISDLMPAASINDFFNLIGQAWKNWKFHYFTIPHYFLFAVSVVVLVILWKRLLQSSLVKIVIASLLTLGAAMLYTFFMAQQYPAHDYYWLDSFFLPIVLLTGCGLALIKLKHKWHQITSYILVFLATGMMVYASAAKQTERYTTHAWDMTESTHQNYTGSAAFLDENNIPVDARILVLDAYTSNVPLLLMQRKGYTVLTTSAEEIEKALKWQFDYIAIQNRSLSGDVLRNYPELSKWLMPVANNGKIGMYKLDKQSNEKAFTQLLQVKSVVSLYELGDSLQSWLKPETAFLPLVDTVFSLNDQEQLGILFESTVSEAKMLENGLHLVLDISNNEGFHYYDNYLLTPFFSGDKSDLKVQVFLNIPSVNQVNTKIKCYIWNPGQNEVCWLKTRVLLTKYI